MRAVRVREPCSAALVVEPAPEPVEEGVRVRVRVAAICATDRKLTRRGMPTDRVLGHEFAGTLDDGTQVGVHPDVGCGDCAACRAGWSNRCPHRRSIGIDLDGGFAEEVIVPRSQAVPIPAPLLADGPLLEPLACCLHALRLLPNVERAAVVGAGAMGVLAMWALQSRGTAVAVCQRSDDRRRLAAELGADAVCAPEGDPAPDLGGPPEAVVVTAPGSAALTWGLERVIVGGAVHAFAGTPGGAEVDANIVHYRHLQLVGSTGSTLADYRTAIELADGGRVPLDRLPRRTVPLGSVPDELNGTGVGSDPEDRGGGAGPTLRTIVDLGGD